MTQPTKDAPFEFEGWTILDTEKCVVAISPTGGRYIGNGVIGKALHAFIEHERDAATHPVDDGVFWHDRCRVGPQPDGSVHVRRGGTVFMDRQHAAANLGANASEEDRDYARAALAFYDAQTPAPEPAWKSWQPGDVGQVRIDGGEWETVFVIRWLGRETHLVRSGDTNIEPFNDEVDAKRVTDSRNVTITPDGAK